MVLVADMSLIVSPRTEVQVLLKTSITSICCYDLVSGVSDDRRMTGGSPSIISGLTN